jgi:hypothetical protein
MTHDDLDALRAEVASVDRRGADADIRLATALAAAGLRDEALAVVEAAIAANRADSAGELEIIGQMDELSALRADALFPRDEIPAYEQTWDAKEPGVVAGGVRAIGRTLRWTQRRDPPQQSWSVDQSLSHFVAFGPRMQCPEAVARALAKLLGAEGQPWFERYVEALRREAERVAAVQSTPIRARASDYYQVEASDFGVKVEPTPAKTRDEFLADLRGTDATLRADAATALRAFGKDPEVLCALADDSNEPSSNAVPSIFEILKVEWLGEAPIHVIRDLVTTGVTQSGRPVCPRPYLARRIGVAWLRRFVEQAGKGDDVRMFEVKHVRPRWAVGLTKLERARSDDEAADVLVEYSELFPNGKDDRDRLCAELAAAGDDAGLRDSHALVRAQLRREARFAVAKLKAERSQRTAQPGYAFSPAEVLDRLVSRSHYLTNFGRVFSTRGGESRYIFFADDRFFDAWHVTETNRLGELGWWSLDAFRKVVDAMFGEQVALSYLASYDDIPHVVLTDSPPRARRVEALLTTLENDSGAWLDLMKNSRGDFFLFLRHDAALGWHGVFLDENARVTGVSPRSRERARSDVERAVRHAADVAPERAEAAVVQRVGEIHEAARSALDRLRSGEAWVAGQAPFMQYVAFVGNAFVWALTSTEDRIQSVTVRDPSRVLEDLLAAFAKNTPPTLVTLSTERREEIEIKADPSRYVELVRRGELIVGGGATTDMQWMIAYRDGRFVHEHGDGFEVHTKTVDEQYVLDVLKNHRYGWVRFTK